MACLNAASSSAVRPHFSARFRSFPAFSVSLFTCARRSFFCSSEKLPLQVVTYVCSDLSHRCQQPTVAHLDRIAYLTTFSSKSASPSRSPSGPCGTGAVTAETSDWRMPCSSSALSVAGDVEIEEGSESMDACEFGCTCSGRASDEWRASPVLFVSADDAAEVGGMCVVGMMRLFKRNAVLRRTDISESLR